MTPNKNYISICIWGHGPGRPYDNSYRLKEKKYDETKNTLTLFFEDNEKCIIINPVEMVWDRKKLKVKSAEKIIWEFYYYGKPQSQETLTIMEYTLLNNSQVCFAEKGNYWNRDEIIDISGKFAFDAFYN